MPNWKSAVQQALSEKKKFVATDTWNKPIEAQVVDVSISRTSGTEVTKSYQHEAVESPAHYNQGNIETWDYIIDQQLNFCLGSAIKYISRAGKKHPNKIVEDLRKAIAFIEREIKEHE